MSLIHYQIEKKSGASHLGKIKFHNNKSIQTPLCWFGLSIIESKEFQLNVFKKSRIEAFLSNAYDLCFQDKKNERSSLIEELQNLNLNHKMDSGGFQLMKAEIKGISKKFPLNQKMVLEKQLEIGCECGVQLDFPFGPDLNKTQKMKRLKTTLENLEALVKLIDTYGVDFSILPVIHTVGNNLELLEYGVQQIKDILGEYPKIIGIGSLVPLVKTIKGSKKNGIKSLIYSLICLRKMLPKTFIHAFGIGGTMAYLAILCGVDSYDSNGWIQKSAYGVIQLPGISDRFLRKETHNRPYLIKNRKQRNCENPINEIDIFMNCKCAACLPFYKKNWKDSNWKNKQKAFIGRDNNSKLLRAIHNVSLYQSEILRIREALQEDNLLDFIKNRLKFSIYFKHIKFIELLHNKDLDNLNDFQSLLELNAMN